jgi:osmotically-inducible protein OsmY
MHDFSLNSMPQRFNLGRLRRQYLALHVPRETFRLQLRAGVWLRGAPLLKMATRGGRHAPHFLIKPCFSARPIARHFVSGEQQQLHRIRNTANWGDLYMNKPLLTMVLVVALAAAYAGAQSTPANPQGAQQPGPQVSPGSQPPGQAPRAPEPGVSPADENKDKDKDKDKSAQSAQERQQLQQQVREQLASDPAFRNVQVNFEDDGKVVLEGTVASKDDRKRAKNLVSGIPGVTKVKEKLKVDESMATAAASPGRAAAGATAGGTAGTMAGSTSAGATTSDSTSTAGSIAGNTQTSTTSGGTASSATGASGGVSGTTAQQPAQAQPSGSAAASSSIAGNTQAGTAGASGSMATGAAPADLQPRIQQALQRENLSGINVVVSGTTIDLSGTVSTGKEKQTAKRIAQSFAGNMKVVDRITVSGMGQGANQGVSPNQNQSTPSPNKPGTVPEQDPNKPR